MHVLLFLCTLMHAHLYAQPVPYSLGLVPRKHALLYVHAQVVQQDNELLPPAACQQLLRETQLREEWRCQREGELLVSLQSSNLVSLIGGSTVENQRLADQMGALKQVGMHLVHEPGVFPT